MVDALIRTLVAVGADQASTADVPALDADCAGDALMIVLASLIESAPEARDEAGIDLTSRSLGETIAGRVRELRALQRSTGRRLFQAAPLRGELSVVQGSRC